MFLRVTGVPTSALRLPVSIHELVAIRKAYVLQHHAFH